MIMMENISEIDVLSSLPSREAMELLSISSFSIMDGRVVKKKVKMYGDTFITCIKVTVSDMFECEDIDKGEKMTADTI